MSSWQTIDTAPKDGSIFDIWVKCKDCEFRGADFTYAHGRLVNTHSDCAIDSHFLNVNPVATHWMPLPPPPTA